MPDLPSLVPPGISLSRQLVVTPALTVQAVVPDLPPVYATPHMIMFMEIVCTELIRPYLPAGWVSVGARVDVRHLAATPVGFTVTATARVLEVTKSLVVFAVEAHDGMAWIGRGEHDRAPVELQRFLAGCARKQSAANEAAREPT